MWVTVLSVLVLLGSAILAGGLVLVGAADVRTFRLLPAPYYVQMHRTLDIYIERFMPPSAILTILGGIALIFLHTETRLRILVAVAVALTATVSGVSHLRNRPINQRLHAWDLDAVPPEFPEVRERWARLHLLRTVASVIALALFAAAVVPQPGETRTQIQR